MFSGLVEVFTRIICRTYLEKPLPKQYSILLNWFIFSLFYRLTFFTLSFRRYFSSRDLTFYNDVFLSLLLARWKRSKGLFWLFVL